jgi:indolepyruvate ferredoxin oxidoreductase
MVGYAAQRGLIPVSIAAIERAIELNGVAVDANLRALAWGRVQAVDPDRVARVAGAAMPPRHDEKPVRTLDEIIEHRARLLTDYQNAAYAQRYRDLVATAAKAESDRGKGLTGFAEAVAVNAAKLMAYKDEYEVARLYTSGAFQERLAAQFEGDLQPRVHLAPPLISRPDPITGEPRKRVFGPWMFTAFKYLARLKGLRGGPLDVFGRSEERRAERRLVEEYFAAVTEISRTLAPENHALAVALAALPQKIRGFGPVKMRAIEAADRERAALMETFRSPEAPATAAE